MSRCWRVILLRGKGQFLREIEAPDAKTAEGAAAAQFGLDEEQCKRWRCGRLNRAGRGDRAAISRAAV
jgi:hypothetical protein